MKATQPVTAMLDRILVIEDEEMLRRSVARGLSKLENVTVSEARDLEQAVASIDSEAPALIVSDIDLPGRSGLELLAELGRRRLRLPVIFVSGFLKAYEGKIPQHADVEVMEKPVELDELRVAVERRLSGARLVAPDSAPFSLADYLQLSCMGRHSVNVTVHRGERELGSVQVWHGEVYCAQDVLGSGSAALSRLAFAERATSQCTTLLHKPNAQNLDGNWEFLLMEAARRKDEHPDEPDPYSQLPTRSQRGDLAPPSSGERPTLADRHFSEAWEEGIEALLARDQSRALAAFLRAERIRPGDTKVRTNLARLRALGFTSDEEVPETLPARSILAGAATRPEEFEIPKNRSGGEQ